MVNAATQLRYPILVKANVGGSGAGIERYDSGRQLSDAARDGRVDFGVDGIALVQELAPLRGAHITRIEVLGGRFLYAIDVFPADTSFNLCPADVCQTTDGHALDRSACAIDAPRNGLRVRAAHPPASIIAEVERIAAYVGLDVGGIELLIDDRDGKHYYYDVNALSNFVAQPEAVIGFDPWLRLVDYLQLRAGGQTVRGLQPLPLSVANA